jgi:hypothetical protein
MLLLRTGRIVVVPVVNSTWKNFCRRGRKVREELPVLDFRAKEIRSWPVCLMEGFR